MIKLERIACHMKKDRKKFDKDLFQGEKGGRNFYAVGRNFL